MNKITFQKLINLLLELIKNKRFDEAEKLSLKITKEYPEHPYSWKVLSVLLKKKGDISGSLVAGKKAIELSPNDDEAHYNLGNTMRELKKLNEALSLYKKTIELNPNYILAYNNLAATLKDLGRLDEAVIFYKKLILLKPNFTEAYNNLGIVLKELKILDKAEYNYRKAIELNPNYAEAYNNLGITLKDLEKYEESIINLEKAIELNPNYAEAYYNLGEAYRYQGKLQDSCNKYRKAIEIKSKYPEAYNNLGIVLRELGQLEESCSMYKKAIELKPEYADAYNNLSFTLLQKYNFKEAFELSEWRWYTEDEKQGMISSSKPIWNGEINSIVYVWKEQGIGDEIMFCSILPEIAGISKKIILNCDKRLIPLFERSFPNNIIYEHNRKNINEKNYDFHISMGSLRRFFRKDLNSFEKASFGYLKSDLKKTNELNKKIRNQKKIIYAGISWGSKSKGQMAFFKTIELKELALRLDKLNIKLINLQYGDISKEILNLKSKYDLDIIDIKEIDKTNDIDGLASLVCACDLIVSIDNFLVQLSGSLGVDTRILLPSNMDSRWGLKGRKSYIYKSASLYRQKELGNWTTVLDEIENDIKSKFFE